VSVLDPYREEIAFQLDEGFALPDIERYLIEPAVELSDDERAALWLYAWSYRASHPPRSRPYEAVLAR
jgi:hypothetical protein